MRSSTKRTSLAAMALGLALGGCSDSPDPSPPVQEATGLLGNGVFRWVCTSDSDSTCGTGVFPTTVALGAGFDLEFSGGDLPEELGLITIEPVSPARLARVSTSLEGQLAGDVSVVAMGGGYAIDYVPFTFRAVDDLIVGQPDGYPPCDDTNSDDVCDGTGGVVTDPPVSLVLGEDTDLRARALGGEEDLAGAIDYVWESLAPEVVAIDYTPGRRARISVVGLGLARISLRVGDYVEVFEYEVQEPPSDTGSTDGEESDGSETGLGTGNDTGAESDTGSEGGSGSESGSSSEGGSSSESGSSSSGETDGATTTGGV